MTQRFKKIKYDGDIVELKWVTPNNADIYTHTVRSPGKPRDAFPGALAAFIPTVLTLMQLEHDYRKGLRVRGLSINDGKDDEGRTLILTCQKTLNEWDPPAIFNTPLIKDADSGEIGRLLEQVEYEAMLFLKGERFLLSFLTDLEGEERERAQSGLVFEVKAVPITDAQIRNSLEGIGFVIELHDIRAWSKEERDAAVHWIGGIVAHNLGASALPEEPDCIATTTMTRDRLDEFLELGPYLVQSAGDAFEIMHRDTKDVIDTLTDRSDAQVRVGKLNRATMLSRDMTQAEVEDWAAKGPWLANTDLATERAWIESATLRERCNSWEEAIHRAARYNRTISEREWRDPNPPRVTDDAVQEVKAAVEAANA